ncbi:hypothetical protein BDR07DRAFT_557440 [Suillus spraguei]|nr:hypothetical protein BDR07DRAFT_557440 [Suillus spraguei]
MQIPLFYLVSFLSCLEAHASGLLTVLGAGLYCSPFGSWRLILLCRVRYLPVCYVIFQFVSRSAYVDEAGLLPSLRSWSSSVGSWYIDTLVLFPMLFTLHSWPTTT